MSDLKDIDKIGESKANGESWEETAQRLTNERPTLSPSRGSGTKLHIEKNGKSVCFEDIDVVTDDICHNCKQRAKLLGIDISHLVE